MINAERLISLLLQAGAAATEGGAVEIMPTNDVDQLEALPCWIFNVIGDGQVSNGRGIWTCVLTIVITAESLDEALSSAKRAYDVVWSWANDPAATVVPGEGWVGGVDDIDMPSRLASANIPGSNITQYSGSWALTLRNR